jgi:hypothetical protein
MGWLGQPDKPKEPQVLPPPKPKKWWKRLDLLTKWRNIMNNEQIEGVIAGEDISILSEIDDNFAHNALKSNTTPVQQQPAPKKKGPKPGFMQEKIASAAAALAAQQQPVANLPIGGSNLYFVEGMVQAVTGGGTSKQHAQQNRIVWADNPQEAMQKYSAYFASLNNPTTFYSVVNMACSEAIK